MDPNFLDRRTFLATASGLLGTSVTANHVQNSSGSDTDHWDQSDSVASQIELFVLRCESTEGKSKVIFGYVNLNDEPLHISSDFRGNSSTIPPQTLETGWNKFVAEWQPTHPDEQLWWQLDQSAIGIEQPVTVRSPTAAEIGIQTDSVPTTAASWTTKVSLPRAQSNMGAAVLNDILYIFGGIRTDTGLKTVPDTYGYDPTVGSEGQWTQFESMPTSLWGMSGVTANGKVYSFGGAPADSPYMTGTPPTDKIFMLQPGGGWTDLTATKGVRCPYPNWAMSTVYNPSDGLIYCLGGGTSVAWANDHPTESTDFGASADSAGGFDCRRIWTFDPVTNTVANQRLTLMPAAKRWPVAARVVVNGQACIHAIGGWRGNVGSTSTNYRYNTVTKTVTTMRATPRVGYYAGRNNPVINNQVYLSYQLVGTSYPGSYLRKAVRYNPSTNTYMTLSQAPAPIRIGSGSGIIGNTLYIAGGHTKQGKRHVCIADTDAYTR